MSERFALFLRRCAWPPIAPSRAPRNPRRHLAGRRRRDAGSARARRSPGRPRTPPIMLNAPLVATGSAIPTCRGSTCSSCSPSSIRRGSWCRRPRASPTRSACRARRRRCAAARLLQQAAGALLETCESGLARARGRVERAAIARPAALAVGAGARAAHRPARARRDAGCSRAARMGGERPSGPSPAQVAIEHDEVEAGSSG